MTIIDIIRRFFDSQNISQISEQSGLDRKTIRKYIKELEAQGIREFDKEKIEAVLPEIIPKITGRPSKSREALEPFRGEIEQLIKQGQDKLKPKSAYEIITEKHGLEGQTSYSSFKRFIHENGIVHKKSEITCRFEAEPGEQVQIDYGKMGLIYDPLAKKNRTVYAFIGTLGYSRHKFIEFVFSQNQQSFAQSHVRMFNFFGGVPRVIYLDNLKTGVIKPDLYEPTINKAYAELAEHYGCFLNPCRPGKPKDKPIVERDVQTVREEFKKLKARDNKVTIHQANESIINWLVNKYGQKNHGTTGLKPYEEFVSAEKSNLLDLPAGEFKAAYWVKAKVHPDHFIQVRKKSYSVPSEYIRKEVMVKLSDTQVYIYFENELIKIHSIPKGARQTDLNDFPENLRAAMNKDMPYALRKKAAGISPAFGELITKVLSPHAFINMKKALGLINAASGCPEDIITKASLIALEDYRHITAKFFVSIIEKLTQTPEEESLNISDETSCFLRNMDYFINSN